MKLISKSFIIFLLFFIIFINTSIPVSAMTFTPQIPIPGFDGGEIQGNSIGLYIMAIYNYAIGVIGIIAVIVMMIGGVIWITAAGSSERINEAKSYIGASILGLILLLCSYTILNTINPNLTKFKSIDPKPTDAPTNNAANRVNTADCCNDDAYCIKYGSNFVCATAMGYGCSHACLPKKISGSCIDNKECEGGICRNGQCTSSNPTEGQACNGGICSPGLKCVFNVPGTTGFCYDGTSGDKCCYNSDCLSGRCNAPTFSVCAPVNLNNPAFTCQ